MSGAPSVAQCVALRGTLGRRRVRRNGDGWLCPALGRNSMIGIGWRRVVERFFPGGQNLKNWEPAAAT